MCSIRIYSISIYPISTAYLAGSERRVGRARANELKLLVQPFILQRTKADYLVAKESANDCGQGGGASGGGGGGVGGGSGGASKSTSSSSKAANGT